MGLTELPEHLERRYTYGGRKAHIVQALFGVEPYELAMCGWSGQWGSPWLGSGSQAEEDKAASLPFCRKCEEEVLRREYLNSIRPKPTPGTRPWTGLPDHKPYEGRCMRDGKRWPCTAAMAGGPPRAAQNA